MTTHVTSKAVEDRDLDSTMRDATETVTRTLGDAAGTVRDLASSTADRVPEAAASARDLLVEVDRQMRGGSDDALMAGTTLAAGLAAGLFIAGANRALVTLAIVPAVAMGLTLLGRTSGMPKARRSKD